MAEAGGAPGGGGVAGANDEADRSFDAFEEEDDKEEGVELAGEGGRRRIHSKELRCMLYGFGDDRNPYVHGDGGIPRRRGDPVHHRHDALGHGDRQTGEGPGGGHHLPGQEASAHVRQGEGAPNHERGTLKG